jgi:hypothetical protein
MDDTNSSNLGRLGTTRNSRRNVWFWQLPEHFTDLDFEANETRVTSLHSLNGLLLFVSPMLHCESKQMVVQDPEVGRSATDNLGTTDVGVLRV